MANTCPNCSAAIDADAVFCITCGKAVSQTILCPKCRGTLTAEAKFCKYCAFDLSQTYQPPSVEPTVIASPIINAPTAVMSPTVAPPLPISQSASQEDKRVFITPSAAAFAVICFFMPWVEYSCGGLGGASFSGSQLASLDSSLWLVPLAAGAIVGAFFYFRSQKQMPLTIPVAMGAFAFAISFLFYKMQSYGRGVDTPFGNIGYDMMGFSLQFGGFLMAISLLAAWLGCYFLLPGANTPNQTFSSNKAAAVCYLLFPLPYLTWLIAPLIFIFKEPYKTDKFIRFHAFQAILLGLAQIAVGIVLALMFIVSDFSKPAYARGGSYSTLALLSIFISTGFFALAGFLAYKAANNQTVKLSVLGDWATKLVDKEIQIPGIKN